VAAWLAVLTSRLRGLVFRRRLDEDFTREIASHIDALTDDHIRGGMAPDEARRAALVRFGGPMQVMEDHREHRSLPLVETTLQDIRYALRTLRKYPAFSLVAIATLAIGVGAGTAVFSFVHAILLRPLPYARPNELVRIFETNPLRNWTRNTVAPANWADWNARNQVFTDIAIYEQFNPIGSGAGDLFLTGFGEPQGLKTISASGNLFTVLGATPLMGRAFTDEETYEGRGRVAILSYGLWQAAFGGDRSIVGKTITLSGRGYDVVGVMPASFVFPGRDVQLWVPLGYPPARIAQLRRPHFMGAVARLKPGVAIARARENMNAVAKQLEAQYPDTNTQMGVRIDALHDTFASEPRTALLMLSGAVGLLFLIVCANIANLQLGRAVGRSRELAIRRALGAARTRLLRQLFTESIVLSVVGGVLGIALAAATQSALTRYAASAIPLFAQVGIDRTVLAFAIAMSFGAPLLFGIVPALLSSKGGTVTERSGSGTRETRTLRNLLVAVEVALSIMLAVGAALLIRSLAHLEDVNPGFVQEHVVAFTMTLPGARYPDAGARFNGFREIERQLKAQPGVQAVGATSTLALKGFTWSGDTTIEGRSATDYERDTRHGSTTLDYFSAMGIRRLAGRWFLETDDRQAPQVTIVNEALARRYFHALPFDQVVGKRMAFGRPQDHSPWVAIVGVVADEKQDSLDKAAEPTAYSSTGQRQQNPLTFVVRAAQPADAVIALARRAVGAVDKDLALTNVTTLEDVVRGSMEGQRFRTTLLAGFAATALFLAALGIYGVLTYFVSQRSRELGIRLALGARPSELFTLVVEQGMRPVIGGALAGLLGAAGLTTLMQSLLFGVQPFDVPTYAAAMTTLAVIAIAACALPALRATRVDPLVALRDE
jgi:putative ABC transport system permease protein